MSDASNDEFNGLEKRIKTLTTMLQNLNLQGPVSKSNGDVPAFLRHFATLLTCGDNKDRDDKKAVSVTGSITHGGIQILIVTQNPVHSSAHEFEVEKIAKSSKTFQELVDGCVYRLIAFLPQC